MSNLPTSSGAVGFSNSNQELNQLMQQSQLQSQLQPHQPGMFRRVLGAVTGMAGNAFVPGLGGALGSIIGGGSAAAASANLAALGQAQNAANFAQASQLLQIAQQSNENSELIELASNLQKAKHESAMSVIRGIGS
jgi:hypothetical protein